MAVTGWKSPGTVDTESYPAGSDWTNPGYAAASDDSDAVNALAKNKSSYYLRAYNFGFTTGDIPSGATIDGIEVDIECAGGVADRIVDQICQLRDSTGRIGTSQHLAGYWPTSDTYRTHGGSANKWGTSITDSDIRATTFGADLVVLCDGNAESCYVDHIRIRVYYHVGTTYNEETTLAVTQAAIAVVGGLTLEGSTDLPADAAISVAYNLDIYCALGLDADGSLSPEAIQEMYDSMELASDADIAAVGGLDFLNSTSETGDADLALACNLDIFVSVEF